MFLAVKCFSLKIVRTLPKIWIIYNAGQSYCWLPKNDYEWKFKNRVQPNEMEAKAANELFECDILFNKEFKNLNDSEMALSRLDLGPEWFFNRSEEVVSLNVTAGNVNSIAEVSLITEDDLDNNFVRSLTEEERYQENKLLCEIHCFKPPIHFEKFKKMDFRYVKTFVNDDLKGGKFLTAEELARMPRKIDKPFCHPGPEKIGTLYDWYLVDSIVQKVEIKGDTFPNFVVRWVGYEDDYNTLEPMAFLKHTAVYKLFINLDLYTACRSNNGCVPRSMTRAETYAKSSCKRIAEVVPNIYDRAITKLMTELQNEARAERYSAEIGFHSYESAYNALRHQHRFF